MRSSRSSDRGSILIPPPDDRIDGWIYLDGGTLDLGVIRDSCGWRALRWVLLRPWRWHRIPRVLRRWRCPPPIATLFGMETD